MRRLSGISGYETEMAGCGREDFWPIVAIEGAKMGQKSGPAKKPAEQVIREIRRSTRGQFSASFRVCAARTVSPSCAAARGLSRTSIIAGQRNSWREAPGRRHWRAATSDEVKALCQEASAPKEVVAELTLKNRLLKKSAIGLGRTAHEIPRRQEAGDHPAGRAIPLPDTPHLGEDNVIQLALDQPALSPRELAVRFTGTESCFVSEASVYRLLKARDLIASPAVIVIKAADAFNDKTIAPNQLWQTD
jgi:hypothetical protein